MLFTFVLSWGGGEAFKLLDCSTQVVADGVGGKQFFDCAGNAATSGIFFVAELYLFIN